MWQTLVPVMQDSWRQLTVQIAHALPNVLASLIIFGLGLAAGMAVGGVARWALSRAKVDQGAVRLGIAGPLARLGVTSTARLLARALKWAIVAVAFIPALYTLDPRIAADLVARTLLYVPHLAVAAALLWVGTVMSRLLARSVLITAVNHEMASPRLLAGATRSAVVLVTVAVMLEQLGIGRATVLTAFAILFGGVTLAAALAVGLGSQQVVRDWLAARVSAKSPQDPGRDPIGHW